MTPNQRKSNRISFTRGMETRLFAIDGTWTRPCLLQDVSEGGARLEMKESIDGLSLKEFFLVLSATGTAFRRCELAWVNGAELGVKFLANPPRTKVAKKPLRRAG